MSRSSNQDYLLTRLDEIAGEAIGLIEEFHYAFRIARAAPQVQMTGNYGEEISLLLSLIAEVHELMGMPGDTIESFPYVEECEAALNDRSMPGNSREIGLRLYELLRAFLTITLPEHNFDKFTLETSQYSGFEEAEIVRSPAKPQRLALLSLKDALDRLFEGFGQVVIAIAELRHGT